MCQFGCLVYDRWNKTIFYEKASRSRQSLSLYVCLSTRLDNFQSNYCLILPHQNIKEIVEKSCSWYAHMYMYTFTIFEVNSSLYQISYRGTHPYFLFWCFNIMYLDIRCYQLRFFFHTSMTLRFEPITLYKLSNSLTARPLLMAWVLLEYEILSYI